MTKITGTLSNAYILPYRGRSFKLMGNVTGNPLFDNGSRITTSEIIAMHMHDGTHYFVTISGSVYAIASWYDRPAVSEDAVWHGEIRAKRVVQALRELLQKVQSLSPSGAAEREAGAALKAYDEGGPTVIVSDPANPDPMQFGTPTPERKTIPEVTLLEAVTTLLGDTLRELLRSPMPVSVRQSEFMGRAKAAVEIYERTVEGNLSKASQAGIEAYYRARDNR